MMRSRLSGWAVLLVASLAFAASAWAARPALVRGPERAFVRRGPGTEFQAFATVENGEQVQVDEVTGTWALVKTTNGQTGYVHAAFLHYPDGQAVLVATPTAAPAGVPAAPIEPAVTPADIAAVAPVAGDAAQRNLELTAEVEALRKEIESLRMGAPPPSPGEDLVSLRAEVRRLADVTDALRSRLDAPSSSGLPVSLGPDSQWATSTVVVLGGCLLVLGWVLGGLLARREERSRRNRIRF